MARLLEINGGQKSLVHIRAVVGSGLREVTLDGIKERLVSVNLAFFVVAEHLNCAVDFRAEKEGLCLPGG
jgi:hypothetical protein